MRRKKQITVGQQFGRLVTVQLLGIGKYGNMWLCQCSCGTRTKVITANLNRGHTTSCGCYGQGLARKYVVNEDFFYTIDTESSAYWLGFLYADGNIGRNLKTVSMSLQKGDINHLRKFLTDISSTHPINFYNPEYPGISIKNKKFCGGLITAGLFPNKSREITPPKLSMELQRHFWRGVMDGDGTISNGKSPGFGLFGNKFTCRGFVEFLQENGVMTSAKVTTNKFGVSSISTSGRVVTSAALNLLYKNCTIFLDRKYSKYLEIIQRN